MHFLKLISTFLKVNIQMSLAYRADTLVNILLNIMWLGWELLGLSIIFNNTTTLGGWGIGELIALLGVFRLINTMMASIIWPNTEKFNQSIRDGSLDYTLLQPAPSMFLVTFSRITIWRMWDLLLSIVLIVAGVRMAGDVATPLNILTFLLLLIVCTQSAEGMGMGKTMVGALGSLRRVFFVLTFFTIGVVSNFKKLMEEGIGKLTTVYVVCLFGFIIWVGLFISWLFFHGVLPPLAA